MGKKILQKRENQPGIMNLKIDNILNEKGFTLVEAVIAAAVLGIGVFSLYLIILLATGLFEAVRRKAYLGAAAVAAALWTTHLGLGLGFLSELLLRNKSRERKTGETS